MSLIRLKHDLTLFDKTKTVGSICEIGKGSKFFTGNSDKGRLGIDEFHVDIMYHS